MTSPQLLSSKRILTQAWAVALLALASIALSAQPSGPSSQEVQRSAMRKLAYLAGHWSGPITVVRGPGEPLHLTQTENVQFKLDGLVLLIEGESTAADASVPFKALATIAYDDAAHAYHFRAYHDGYYVDTELTVQGDGFSWGFNSGPAHIVNSMHLTAAHEWHETTEVTLPNGPPHQSVEMTLRH